MKPRFLSIASLLSLLLCVVTAVVWVRSHTTSDLLIWEPHKTSYSAFAERGRFCFRRIMNTGGATAHWRYYAERVVQGARRVPPQSPTLRFGGFWYEKWRLKTQLTKLS